jgi:hypothetical protein
MAYKATGIYKTCERCGGKKGISAFTNGNICRSCLNGNAPKKEKTRQCSVCGRIFTNGKGTRCVNCCINAQRVNYERHRERIKQYKYTIAQIELLRQFVIVYKRRSKAEFECHYKDCQKYLRTEREQTEAHQLIKKFMMEWERVPRSKANFEELYNQVVLLLK